MKFKEKIKNFKIKNLFKKVDPISFALVLLLGASATFAGFQLAFNTGDTPVVNPHLTMDGEEDMAVTANDPEIARLLEETVIAPIQSEDFEVTMQYFDSGADATELVNHFFYYQVGASKYSHQSKGMSFRGSDDEATNVVAALSGTVVNVEDEILRGTVVTIEHQNSVQTVYTGVYDVTVEVGAEVLQGDVIGVTGLSQLEPEAGNVVHFEIIQNGSNLNPKDVIEKPLASI